MTILVERGIAPLIIAFPHGGTEFPADLAPAPRAAWHARRDTDWWIDTLYAFGTDLGVTTVRTTISRTAIDVNRDPSGASLYPGAATTELCPTTDFDGVALYRDVTPDAAEIARRRQAYFDPYHAALCAEIVRLRAMHPRVVLYDAHAIRSRIPRLFDGILPQFNIGTNDGTTCDPQLASVVAAVCAQSGHSYVLDGRFKGGWTTRHYGRPQTGVHALQMELAMRGYMEEPDLPSPECWPTPPHADPVILPTLRQILAAALDFAKAPI